MAGDGLICDTKCLENGDKVMDKDDVVVEQNIDIDEDLSQTMENVPCPEFQFPTMACYICNGYYGPCFGEPVCATCHAFLFPNDIGCVQMPIFSQKTDDEDSGNDEPTDLYYSSSGDRRASQPPNPDPNPRPYVHFLNPSPRNHSNNDVLDQFNNVQESPEKPEANPEARDNSDSDEKVEDLPRNPEKPHRPHCVWNCRLYVEEGGGESSKSCSLSERLEVLSNHKRVEHEPMNEQGLVERLPPEVLLAVFSHLDDMSLWSAANVCRRWCSMLLSHVMPQQWQQHVNARWPLYSAVTSVGDWYKVYDSLASSAPCRACLAQTTSRTGSLRMEENSWRGNRLRSELKSLRGDPPEGIKAMPLDPMCCHWQATITGPVGSPYEGGLFYLYLQVPQSYPMCPPMVRFLTKILHPNVSRHGDVGIDSIHHNWSLALTISKVLISVQSLLTDPYCQVCMEPELGKMYVNDRERFEDVARAWTWKYAMNDVIISS